MQLWPANENAFAARRVATSSRSASAATITGVALPSSRFTRLRGAARELPADAGRAGERDERDALVVDEDVADLAAGPTTTFSHPAGSPASSSSSARSSAGQRRLRRGLQHDRTAGGERRGDLVRDEVEREVERRDRADDADRNAERERDLALRQRGTRPSERRRRRASGPRRRPS